MQDFKKTFREVMQAIFPIIGLIVIIQILILGTPLSGIIQFLLGSTMVIIGVTCFLIGITAGLLPMGKAIGSELPHSRSVALIASVAFLFGFLATVAEPDVRVLTSMIESVSNGGIAQDPLILVIAIGVGFFTSTAMLRIIYQVPIAYLITAGYVLVLLLALVTPQEYLSIAFDAGGVTTGPVTVPFILALGIGIVSVLGGRSTLSEGFGLIGL
ncbi:MAG: DUF1538 domain-containing protein, partial [Methanomicrobiaceae archaeon]|nr:DUF1538 domain-containing protein [Methanomicrobiaceae archaeon]